MIRHHHTLLTALAVFGLFGTASSAQAGWITITNNTKQLIIIQETGGPFSRPIRGKSVKLQPGETYREFQLTSGTKNVQVYDAATPTAPLLHDKLIWDRADVAFAVKTDGKTVTLVSGTERKDDKSAVKK